MVDETSGTTIKSHHPPLPHGWSTTCSIYKLPPELISYVTALSLPETYSARERMKALYSTRMVSRIWRNSIDSTPSLWNVISSNLPLHVNSTIIQRSGCYPLDVSITGRVRHSQRSGFTELAAKEVWRWSTMKLRLQSSDAGSLYLASPAPLLRSLCVTSRGWINPTTSVALFGGIAPRLEVLEVSGAPMDWTSSFIRGLRELELSDMNDGEISTQQVLEILAITALLEKLGITNSILDHRLPPFQIPRAMIQLPNLKTIHLSEINGEATGAILSSIRAHNCTSLKVYDWGDGRDGLHSFPEPGLTHFNDFLRRTLSANNNSEIDLLDEGLEWYSPSGGVGSSGFELCIRYGATAIWVEWATRIIGLGDQELVHDLEVTISHDRLAEDDLAAYRSISRLQSVTQLTVHYNYPLPRPILDLLGSWQDSEDGTRPFPAFPRLGTLVLVSSQTSWLDDLEILINRRFGGREDFIGEQVPSLGVVLDPGVGPHGMVDLAQLQRLRAAKGVRSITRNPAKHISGMLAAVYDGDTEL